MTKATGRPYPGDELVWRVLGVADRDAFEETGRRSVEDLSRSLAAVGRTWESCREILDFGCGCGRLLLWLEDVGRNASLHGVDVDERAIRWAAANIPWASFRAISPRPPLPFGDASFDLVIGLSVLTHLDELDQDRWLAELRRVARPGGLVLLTVHGEHVVHLVEQGGSRTAGATTSPRRELSRKGIAFNAEDIFVGGPFPDSYHSTFHAPWYVFQHWGTFFDVAGYIPKGSLGYQDLVLLRRPADDAVGGEPIAVDQDQADDDDDGAAGTASRRSEMALGESALERAARLLHEGSSGGAAGGGGKAASVRRVLGRLSRLGLRRRAGYQAEVNGALFNALWELQGGIPAASNTFMWHAVRLQGERINRLESDVWDALRPDANRAEPGPPRIS